MARRYKRDKRGRFAAKGYSGQTSGTGSRLKGDGKQRAGGGKVVSPKRMSGTPSNTISKSSTKRQVNANSRKVEARIKKQTAERSGLQASSRVDSLLRKEKAARKNKSVKKKR
jgi:hypothetical protein